MCYVASLCYTTPQNLHFPTLHYVYFLRNRKCREARLLGSSDSDTASVSVAAVFYTKQPICGSEMTEIQELPLRLSWHCMKRDVETYEKQVNTSCVVDSLGHYVPGETKKKTFIFLHVDVSLSGSKSSLTWHDQDLRGFITGCSSKERKKILPTDETEINKSKRKLWGEGGGGRGVEQPMT